MGRLPPQTNPKDSSARSLTQDDSRRLDADASPLPALRCVAVAHATPSSRALAAARVDAQAAHGSLGSGS